MQRHGALDKDALVAICAGARAPARIRLDAALPLSEAERLRWQRDLDRHRNACGCAEATAGLCLGLGWVAAAIAFPDAPWSALPIAWVLIAPALLLTAGKGLGRWWGMRRFRRHCHRLLARLAAINTQGA